MSQLLCLLKAEARGSPLTSAGKKGKPLVEGINVENFQLQDKYILAQLCGNVQSWFLLCCSSDKLLSEWL